MSGVMTTQSPLSNTLFVTVAVTSPVCGRMPLFKKLRLPQSDIAQKLAVGLVGSAKLFRSAKSGKVAAAIMAGVARNQKGPIYCISVFW